MMPVAIFNKISVHGGPGETEQKAVIPIAKSVQFMMVYENDLEKVQFFHY
jgi:hypothetical protein